MFKKGSPLQAGGNLVLYPMLKHELVISTLFRFN